MSKFRKLVLLGLIVLSFTGVTMENLEAKTDSSFYQQTIQSIGGEKLALSQYKGKPVLLVNIATKCGYTPQLEGLEKVYQKYQKKGLVVLGIPSNDFGGQTPEKESDVKKFCKLNYGVTFPLTAKTVVKGDKRHPLISSLLSQAKNKKDIGWNFEKFLIDKNGQLVDRFQSSVKPEDTSFQQKIESVL